MDFIKNPVEVKIFYGPYLANGLIKHRIQRIYSLIDQLESSGYKVIVIQDNCINRLLIEIAGRKVFQCNIKNLMFNMPYDYDIVCQRAVDDCKNAINQMQMVKNSVEYSDIKQYFRNLKNADFK